MGEYGHGHWVHSALRKDCLRVTTNTHDFENIFGFEDFPDYLFDGLPPILCLVFVSEDSVVEPAGVIKLGQNSDYGTNLVGENWAALRSGGPSGPGALR